MTVIGLGLGKVKETDPINGSRAYNVSYGSVKDIHVTTGMTQLANTFLFNLLSKYNPKTGVGSNFKNLIASPLFSQISLSEATLLLTNEVVNLEKRMISTQRKEENLTSDSRLQKIEILSIDVDLSTQTAIIEIRLINQANENVYLKV